MSIERLKREGWFDKKRKEIEILPFSDEELAHVRAGGNVLADDGKNSYMIYLKDGSDLKNLTEDDLIIHQMPYASTGKKHNSMLGPKLSPHDPIAEAQGLIEFFDIALGFFAKKEDLASWLSEPSDLYENLTPLEFIRIKNNGAKRAAEILSRLANP